MPSGLEDITPPLFFVKFKLIKKKEVFIEPPNVKQRAAFYTALKKFRQQNLQMLQLMQQFDQIGLLKIIKKQMNLPCLNLFN